MLVSLTVGKVDAGVAVLLTEDKRLIEFPSILLPPDIHSGSIVDINVARNQQAELVAEQKFSQLQDSIFEAFGTVSPSAPVLRCRNTTQTSVVLEWDPIHLATAELRSLSLYRNGTKAGVIPRDKLSTKISGLALETEYTFHLVLRTSAGQYTSEKITIKTHKMTDLTGITVTPGVMPAQLRDSLAETVERIGAKFIDSIRIDTTHFVCTEPRGIAWEKAKEMNVPVVVPDWIKGCEREGRIVGVRSYYLDADPKHRQIGPSATQQRADSAASVAPASPREGPRIEHTPPTPERANGRAEHDSGAMASEPPTPPPKFSSHREEDDEEDEDEDEGVGAARTSLAATTIEEKTGEGSDAEEDEEGGEEEEEDDDDDDAQTEKGDDEKPHRDETSSGGRTPGGNGNFDDVEL